MLELLVLGSLSERPAHGYAIKQSVDLMTGFWKPISWGSLYPILQALEKTGMISCKTRQQAGGPVRKIYDLTPAGKRQFLKLMLQPATESEDSSRLFRYKMLFFHKITRRQRIAVIEAYQHEVEGILAFVESHLSSTQMKASSNRRAHYVFTLVDHSVKGLYGEQTWLEELLEEEQRT